MTWQINPKGWRLCKKGAQAAGCTKQARLRLQRDQRWAPSRERSVWGRDRQTGGVRQAEGVNPLVERTCTVLASEPSLCLLLKRRPQSNLTAGGSGESSEKQTLSDSVRLRQGPRSCISSKLPGDAAGPWTQSTSALDDRLANGDQREGV